MALDLLPTNPPSSNSAAGISVDPDDTPWIRDNIPPASDDQAALNTSFDAGIGSLAGSLSGVGDEIVAGLARTGTIGDTLDDFDIVNMCTLGSDIVLADSVATPPALSALIVTQDGTGGWAIDLSAFTVLGDGSVDPAPGATTVYLILRGTTPATVIRQWPTLTPNPIP